MPISVKQGSINTTLYGVKGNDLKAVLKSIMKKGPTDPNEGKRYSGLCECNAELVASGSKLHFDTYPKSGKFWADAFMKKGAITYKCIITMPKLAQGKLSKSALNEWKRFVSAVKVHELGHVKEFGNELKNIGSEIEAIKTGGFGANAKAAAKAAHKAFAKQLNKIDMTKRLTKNAMVYDRKTGHGKTQGAVLKTSIP